MGLLEMLGISRGGYRQKTLATFSAGAKAVAFSSRGELLAVATGTTVVLVDPGSGAIVRTLEFGDCNPESIAFSPDGRTLVSAGNDKNVRIIDVKTATSSERVPNIWVSALAYSPDGGRLAIGTHQGEIYLFPRPGGRDPLRLDGHTQGYVRDISALAFDGKGMLASASEDSTVQLWGVGRPEVLRVLAHDDGVLDVAFSPAARLLASGCKDAKVRLWNPDTGERVATLDGHTSGVPTVAFSPDGKLLASGGWGEDESVRLWDVATMRPLEVLRGHDAPVLDVSFRPDGSALASASSSHLKTIILWSRTSSSPPTQVAEAPRTRPDSRQAGDISFIVFREGDDSPDDVEAYCADIFQRKYTKTKLRVRESRVVPVARAPASADAAAALYVKLAGRGDLPSLGDAVDELQGRGSDGRNIVVLFFR